MHGEPDDPARRYDRAAHQRTLDELFAYQLSSIEEALNNDAAARCRLEFDILMSEGKVTDAVSDAVCGSETGFSRGDVTPFPWGGGMVTVIAQCDTLSLIDRYAQLKGLTLRFAEVAIAPPRLVRPGI